MFEKLWLAVPPTLFTADGGMQGQIQVTDTKGFRVKASVAIVCPSQPNLLLQIKRVLSSTLMLVGPLGKSINDRSDLSSYTVLLGAYLYQDVQDRVTIAPADIVQAVYDQEPAVRIRTGLVDGYGNDIDNDNPLPVAFDGTVSIGTVKVEGNNGNTIEPNPDGSINVNILPSTSTTNVVRNTYNEITGIIKETLTTLVTYSVPVNKTGILQRGSASGENIATFTLSVNGVVQYKKRTYFASDFNVEFDLTTGQDNGFLLQPSDTVTIEVIHHRPDPGDFEARIQVFEILS